MEEVEAWRNRPLQSFYPFAFVDCIYVSLRTEYGVQQVAVYVMLAYDVNGCKDVLASGSTRRRASMTGCRSPTSCGLAALRILLYGKAGLLTSVFLYLFWQFSSAVLGCQTLYFYYAIYTIAKKCVELKQGKDMD